MYRIGRVGIIYGPFRLIIREKHHRFAPLPPQVCSNLLYYTQMNMVIERYIHTVTVLQLMNVAGVAGPKTWQQ